jgi:uncharacterized membrane protein YidH (DUF202 family)
LNQRGRKKGKAALLKGSLFVAAVLLLPFTVALLLHLPDLFTGYDRITTEMLLFCGGFGFFVVLFLLFGPPVKSYILEHELSHVIFAALSGVRVKKVVIRKYEGYVRTEKVNLVIALAPYSLPLYTLVVFTVYRVVALFNPGAIITSIFYFLMGLTVAFHLVATVHYLQLEQPDLKRYGYFPSLVLIFTWSVCVVALVLALLFERIQVLFYFRAAVNSGVDFYLGVVRYFFA